MFGIGEVQWLDAAALVRRVVARHRLTRVGVCNQKGMSKGFRKVKRLTSAQMLEA
jgi:hypothetical protein